MMELITSILPAQDGTQIYHCHAHETRHGSHVSLESGCVNELIEDDSGAQVGEQAWKRHFFSIIAGTCIYDV
jgi:hypothetical protein